MRDGERVSERERERERERESRIATMNTSSAGILARVVISLYYVLHAIRDGMHRELTVLQKLHRPCRAELLRVSSELLRVVREREKEIGRGREGGR